MHILLTRPLEDNHEMILKFKLLGHEVSHMPLISIEGIKYEDLNFSDFKGIIFTSSNAIKFLDTKSVDKKINCFCVGSATESKAKSIGFQNIFAADGNVNNLKELILQNFNSSDGKLLYVSGEIISNDLDQILISEGYNVQRIINYKANPVEKFSDTFIEKLKLNMPEIVYVYSQNSAISFLNLIKKNNEYNREKIIKTFVDLQYKRNDQNFYRGTFRVRGDNLEIFPSHLEDRAWRISIFKDKIDNIVEFDPLTGNKIKNLDFIKIYANSHYITPRPTLDQAIREIKKELESTLKKHKSENKLLEAQRLDERTRFDLEMLEATGTCAGIENYSRFLTGRNPGEPPPTLFEYFPDNTLIFVDESHVTVPQLNGMYKGDYTRKKTLSEYGFRLPSCMDNRPLKFEEWNTMRTQTIFVSATPGPWELEQTSGKFTEQVIRPTGLCDPEIQIRPAKNQVDDLLAECKEVAKKNYRSLVTTLTKRMAEDLTEYLHENGVRVRYMHSDIDTLERIEIMRDLRMGVFDVLVGINLLREGLDIPECGLVAILDADKEGFLRSERSLIQTIGRAARNIEGKAILYADKKTKSIENAIRETERRRKIQEKYNKKNNITATSIKKGIVDILESVYEKDYAKSNLNIELGHNLKKHLKALKKRMKESAENLEFEEAAKTRDEIRKLEASELEIGINPKLNKSKLNNRVYPEGRSTQGKPGTRPKRKR